MIVTAVFLGLIFSAGVYLVLRRDAIRVVIGCLIISQVANIYLMIIGGKSGGVPIIGHSYHGAQVSNPLPQAMVLTAIVIGFATTGFLLSLVYRFYEENQEIDLESLRGRDS